MTDVVSPSPWGEGRDEGNSDVRKLKSASQNLCPAIIRDSVLDCASPLALFPYPPLYNQIFHFSQITRAEADAGGPFLPAFLRTPFFLKHLRSKNPVTL